MKKSVQMLMLFFLANIVIAAPRTALVIGNSAYESSPLTNPTNDAEDISAKLKTLGFNVMLQLNASRKELRTAIREYGQKLRKVGGTGIFFYAGHGMQVKGKNYLIPIGSDIHSEYEVADESVEADLVLRALEDAGNPLNIVVLDACRDNPFARSFRSSAKGLARMEGGSGTIIAYSTGPGNVALDGEGRNSPYTKYLLENMTITGLSIEQVFKRVRVGVEKDSNGQQTPWETSSLRGDFYFVPEQVAPKIVPEKVRPKIIAKPQPIKKIIKPQSVKIKAHKKTKIAIVTPEITRETITRPAKLLIYTNPAEAKIRILNKQQPYVPDMPVSPGDYNIEVSKEGYISKKQWLFVDKDDIKLQVTLVPNM